MSHYAHYADANNNLFSQCLRACTCPSHMIMLMSIKGATKNKAPLTLYVPLRDHHPSSPYNITTSINKHSNTGQEIKRSDPQR